jgi:hypothetical protein
MAFKFISVCTFINLVLSFKESQMVFYISMPKGSFMGLLDA